MSIFAEEKELGQIYGSRVACRFDDRSAARTRHPLRPYRTSPTASTGEAWRVSPDLAIEIVSPESVERDYEDKRKQYQRFGVPEYWIIDEEEKTILLLRLNTARSLSSNVQAATRA